jgi:hypothetical protein
MWQSSMLGQQQQRDYQWWLVTAASMAPVENVNDVLPRLALIDWNPRVPCVPELVML